MSAGQLDEWPGGQHPQGEPDRCARRSGWKVTVLEEDAEDKNQRWRTKFIIINPDFILIGVQYAL